MCVTESLKCVEVEGTEISCWVLADKVSSSHSFSSVYSSTVNFSIIKSLQILYFLDVHWQDRLTWIKTYLHTRFQIPHDGSLLYETDEISFTTNLAGRRSELLVRNVHTLAIDTEICISLNRLKSLSKFIRVCSHCHVSDQQHSLQYVSNVVSPESQCFLE